MPGRVGDSGEVPFVASVAERTPLLSRPSGNGRRPFLVVSKRRLRLGRASKLGPYVGWGLPLLAAVSLLAGRAGAQAPEETADPANATSEPASPLVPPGGVPQVGPLQPPPAPPAPEPVRRRESSRDAQPVVHPSYAVALHLYGAVTGDSSFDRALRAHRYSASNLVPVGYFDVAVAVVDWLWVGGRLGTRGRVWGHADREEASLSASDLVATVQLRFTLGRIVEIGVLAAGGAAYQALRLNGVLMEQVTPRFAAEAVLAFRIGDHFAIGPRFGWDYFQWQEMNAYDHSMDVGGPYVGLAVEGRE